MGLRQSLIQILVMSGVLAFWELFGKPIYANYVSSEGLEGFGTTMLSYFLVLLVGYILARVISGRKVKVE